MDLANRVALRYMLRVADTIGDPEVLVRQFQLALTNYERFEHLIGPMREADKERATNPEAARWWSSNRYDFLFAVKNGYVMFHRVGFDLFLALLQQYEIPTKLRKAVEAAAKFYGRNAVQKPPRDKEVDVYEKYLFAYRDQLALAKAVLAQGKPQAAGDGETTNRTVKAGPFTVVNTGGFPDETMKEVAGAVAKAASLLQRKGLGKVCYGDVLASNTLQKSTVLAFYIPGKDEMFVRANIKGKVHDTVYTLCHELGHRLFYKFLKSKEREIRGIYYKLQGKVDVEESALKRSLRSNPSLQPKVGDTIEAAGKTFEVTGLSWGSKGQMVGLINRADPTHKGSITLDGWLAGRAKEQSIPASVSVFVTRYAAKDFEENFSEMLAHYCMDTLPEDQVAMLEAVLG